MEPAENPPEFEALRQLKHDIKNELAGMILCLEQLRYEITDPQPDWEYYMDSISNGCKNINKLLK
ncbi:hypothetical protein [Mucilaginibacter myungsuensis]|uniref:Signal transduction histidine kinase dimerisation/phosphoacceptor domain-containing protein n=1 Tax=Mucilaginibacter myungsuensis TaxID=649104 RepID=A0A929L1S3_9SPHI|nr:hypothetical protein [Mucilaginibacter myungsuensis]MBE9661666.1 hypothetical protein [Mucilaginibacter myungsuensis]MDN3597810.1 hypothetical protein [Mucilaginibacter myungsuensis]